MAVCLKTHSRVKDGGSTVTVMLQLISLVDYVGTYFAMAKEVYEELKAISLAFESTLANDALESKTGQTETITENVSDDESSGSEDEEQPVLTRQSRCNCGNRSACVYNGVLR